MSNEDFETLVAVIGYISDLIHASSAVSPALETRYFAAWCQNRVGPQTCMLRPRKIVISVHFIDAFKSFWELLNKNLF